MAINPFGGFCHTSPLASSSSSLGHHDPLLALSSNCIRDVLGPTVQTVADCLMSRHCFQGNDADNDGIDIRRSGRGMTLGQIVSTIRARCLRPWTNEERERLVARVVGGSNDNHPQRTAAAAAASRGPASAGYVTEIEPIRQALVVLIQHGMVDVQYPTATQRQQQQQRRQQQKPTYRFVVRAARLVPVRYPRFVEYTKRALDGTAVALVEEFLVRGQMTTVDGIVSTVVQQQQQQQQHGGNVTTRYALCQAVVESFRRLVVGGFIIQQKQVVVSSSSSSSSLQAQKEEEGEDEDEMEFETELTNDNGVVVKVQDQQLDNKDNDDESMTDKDNHGNDNNHDNDDDPAVMALLDQEVYRNVLMPRGQGGQGRNNVVWTVNVRMFHESIRAFCLGRLVAERFGHVVQAAGSMITASLKLESYKRHGHASGRRRREQQQDCTVFTPNEIVPYLPKPVQQVLGKKKGGIVQNLSSALVQLTKVSYPTVLVQVEDAEGHDDGGKFQVATRQLVNHLHDRIHHQVVLDSHGEVAARICSILIDKGHLEADAIAEMAMVPTKDTREILHKLYRANYVDLLTLQQTKQHNPASMIYLWTVKKSRMHQTVTDNVCRAMTNLRLRRQHEESIGRDLIERAREAVDVDVNEQEVDKANYQKFCLGLERLDNAILQLDETLMVLLDF